MKKMFGSAGKKKKRIGRIRLRLSLIFLGIITGCAPQISFQVQRPAEFQIEDIEYLAIGKFREGIGKIPLPSLRPDNSFLNTLNLRQRKSLEPVVENFDSNAGQSLMAADILRAQLLEMLSTNSPWVIINSTGEKTGFSGSIPDSSRVAVLGGRIKYAEIRHEGREKLRYFVTVENKGTSFEQMMLAKTASVGAETMGAGFLLPTPYVELIAAMEIEMTLKRRNGTVLVPPQTHRAYYVRKWGGSSGLSLIHI